MIHRWFAFTTVPGREKAALAELERFAPLVRLPMGMKLVKRHGRSGVPRKRAWPLMAGYAFAGFDAPAQLVTVLDFLERARRENIPHALRQVVATHAGTALELKPDAHNRAWFEQMDYSTVELPDGQKRPLGWQEGDPVKLTEGPFSAFSGVVERVSRERAVVIVSIFGRLTRVDVSVRDLVRSRPVPVDGGKRSSS